MGKWLLLTGVVCLLFTGQAAAQVAQPHLVSKGNLLLAPGNPSEIEGGTIRPYAGYGTQDGKTEWVDDTSADFTATQYYGAADILLGGISLSLGYQSVHAESEYNFQNVLVTQKQETDFTMPVIQVAGPLSDWGSWGVSVALVTIESTTDLELDGEQYSGSVKHDFTDILIGASYRITEAFRVGAQYYPEVVDKADYDGDFSTLESVAGHGAEWTLGIGWLPMTALAIGLDYTLAQEHEESESPREWEFELTADAMFSEAIVLSPEITYYESEKLAVDGDPSVSPRKGVSIGGTIYWIAVPARNLVLGFSATRAAEEASDYGDAEFDEDRFDRADAMTYELSLSMVF